MSQDPRERQLERLDDAIQEAHRKVVSGRITDPENERVRVKWVRALASVAAEHRKTLEDRDLDELRDRLNALENDGSDYRLK